MVPNGKEEKFTEQEPSEDPWESEPPPSKPVEKDDNKEDT